LYGIFIFYITYLAKKEGERGAFINNLINGIVFIMSITINFILISLFNLSTREFLEFPFNLLMILFIIIFIPLFSFFISREKHRIKIKKQINNKLKAPSFTELPLKYELYRKITHFVVIGIIFFYFPLGILNQNLVVFFVGISLIGLLTADIIRILTPELYPLKPVNQLLREKELHMRLGPHISMSIGCFSIILLYGIIQPIGPVVISVSMIMSVFGDVASNLVGRTIGHQRIRETNKTFEGLIAGILSAFISGIIALYLLKDYYNFSIVILILIPSIASMIIGLLDYLDLSIDDNLSFNFFVATILFFISISLL
jgi:dolichol kinase